jgi:NitT/TauT family transport system substrate-binding protein
MNARIQLSIIVSFALTFCFLPSSQAGQADGKPEKSNLVISYAQASGSFTPLWVAYETGLFKKYGIEATLKVLNAQVATQALVGGEIDVVFLGPDLVNARLQGVPVKYIGGMVQRFVFQLWGAKGITTLAELKGKTVAVTTPRTSTEIATRELLKKIGTLSDKDVNFLYVQTVPAILTSVMNGKTHAGTLSAPNTLKAKDAGLNLLADISQHNIPGLHVAYGSSDNFIKSNPNSILAFLKAIAEATALSKQNPAVTKKIIAKYSDLDDPKLIDGTYDQFAPYWDSGLAMRAEAVRGQLAYLDEKEFPHIKDAQPGDFFDNSFVETLRKTGFLQAVGAVK